MADYHDLVQALTWLLVNKLQNKSEYTRGLLGNGQGHVEVPDRPDYSYVRPDRFTTRVAEIFNKTVGGPDGLPVILGELPWQPGLTQVLSVDWDTYLGVGWGDATPGIAQHGQTHEWRDAAPGVDSFNVYRRQMGDLRCYPVGSGSTSIFVSPYNFTHLDGDLKSWTGLPGLDLSDAIPGTTGTARMALVYWDPCSGTSGWLGVATGTIGVDAEPEILNRPAAPPGTIPSAWVRLAGGQTSITEFDMWDARPLWQPSLEFATGSCGIWAGIIPIGDPGDNFTGTTVESALEELADSGGAPDDAQYLVLALNAALSAERRFVPGTNLTGTDGGADGDYTLDVDNPLVGGVDMNGVDDLVLDADGDTYIDSNIDDNIRVFTGGASRVNLNDTGLAVDVDIKLSQTDRLYLDSDLDTSIRASADDQIDFEIASADEAHLTAYGLSAQNHAFRVTNSSGGAVVAGDVGYIDENGEYVETTTEHDDVAWCVVVKGGADTADIYVARRGQVTVTLDQNCSAGDYLYTSTTAGQATSETYVRPEVFAVALTANGAGAGGTCEALLLCNRATKSLTSSNDLINIQNASSSDWQSTCNGAPVGAVVTYNVPLTNGAEDAIVPTATTELGNLVLHNTTRTEEAFIDSVNVGANTITVTAAADVAAWANADVIEVRSQTNTTALAGSYYFDVEVTSTEVPALAVGLHLYWDIIDTGSAGQNAILHPYEADSGSKRFLHLTQVANVAFRGYALVQLKQRRFCVLWIASGASTFTYYLKMMEVVVAAP